MCQFLYLPSRLKSKVRGLALTPARATFVIVLILAGALGPVLIDLPGLPEVVVLLGGEELKRRRSQFTLR